MIKTGITRTVNGLLRTGTVLAILASWREAILIQVKCYKVCNLQAPFSEKSRPDARYYGLKKILGFGKRDYAVLLRLIGSCFQSALTSPHISSVSAAAA